MPGVAGLLWASTSQISPRKGLGADPGSQLVVAKTVVAFQDFQFLKGDPIRIFRLFFDSTFAILPRGSDLSIFFAC
jgi:hypothetical protein